MPRDGFHAAAVDADLVAREVGLGAELGDGLAIEADPALADQLLGGTTGSDARGREQLLQSLHGAILVRRGGGVNDAIIAVSVATVWSLPRFWLSVPASSRARFPQRRRTRASR